MLSRVLLPSMYLVCLQRTGVLSILRFVGRLSAWREVHRSVPVEVYLVLLNLVILGIGVNGVELWSCYLLYAIATYGSREFCSSATLVYEQGVQVLIGLCIVLAFILC